MYCKSCGTENTEQAKFCKKCGELLPDSVVTGISEINGDNVKLVKQKSNRRLWISIVILTIITAVVIALIPSIKNIKEKQRYNTYIADGQKYLEALDYVKAEDAYLQAIQIDSKQKEPYFKLADIYEEQEEYEKAIEILKKAEKNIENLSFDETDSDKEFISVQDRINRLENMKNFTWIVEPTIEADDIYYVQETDAFKYTYNDLAQHFKSPYAVVKKGETLGLINYDGELEAELEYKKITKFSTSHYLLECIQPKYSESFQTEWNMYVLDEFGNIEEAEGMGSGAPSSEFYWCEGLHYRDENAEWMMDYLITPKTAIPVLKSSKIWDSQNEMEPLKPPYAICKDGQLVTKFEYDECGSCSEGLLAVCKDGKWGYVDEEGKIVIPIEYDASWSKYGEYNSFDAGILKDYCYAASYGYVNLCKNGKWELKDIEGKQVILPGFFEKICPVYEGKCWVKKDGKWGVIQLNVENKKQVENVTPKYLNIYGPILNEIFEKSGGAAEFADDNTYFLYDIDKDNIKELIALQGTCNADYMYQVYTIKNNQAKYLGEISGFSCSFYMDETGGTEKYMIRSEGHMGYSRIEYISIESGEIKVKEILSEETENYYSNSYPIKMTKLNDMSLLN